MRKIIGLMAILLCVGSEVVAQKARYFKVDTLTNALYLTPANGMKHPGVVKIPYDIPISLKQNREAIVDIKNLLKQKFPEVSDDDFLALKEVVYMVYFSKEGKVTYYEIRIPVKYIDIFSHYEKRLYEVAETLSSWDFSRYGLNIPFKDEPVNPYGVIGFSLLWVRSNPPK